MAIASMTGFAREEGAFEGTTWRWEVRSVNGRGLDVRVRMPPGFESVEPAARDLVAARFKRGNVNLTLNVTEMAGVAGYRLNEALLEKVIAVAAEVRERSDAAPPRVDGLLRVRGVLEPEEPAESDETRAAREAALTASLDAALDQVGAARREEGTRLEGVILGLIDEIGTQAARARELAAAQPDAIKARVGDQLRELLGSVPQLSEERLAQEAAMIAGKADVREELDRLEAHVSQARELLSAGGPVGRRLDFLAQEFNREANTLCSKAQDLELTRTGLALKAAIEQFREQIQNIE